MVLEDRSAEIGCGNPVGEHCLSEPGLLREQAKLLSGVTSCAQTAVVANGVDIEYFSMRPIQWRDSTVLRAV